MISKPSFRFFHAVAGDGRAPGLLPEGVLPSTSVQLVTLSAVTLSVQDVELWPMVPVSDAAVGPARASARKYLHTCRTASVFI